MTVANPSGWLQNAGNTHTAAQLRNAINAIVAGSVSSGSLVTRGGVNTALGNKLQVTQTGSPSMAVLVRSGHAVVPGSENTTQGGYHVYNDADVTLTVTAAHASLPRIDLVCFKVEDSQYSGSNNLGSLVVVAGTPAGSPVAPTAPNNSLTLAQIAVGAGVTSIVNANITDTRRWIAAAGGTIVCTSTTRPASGTVVESQVIYETDTDIIYVTTDGGATWSEIARSTDRTIWSTYTPTWSSTGTAPALGNGTIAGRYKQIGKIVIFHIQLVMGSTTTYGTGNWQFSIPVTAISNATAITTGTGLVNDDSSVSGDQGLVPYLNSSTTILAKIANGGQLSATAPLTWVTNDEIRLGMVYEAV